MEYKFEKSYGMLAYNGLATIKIEQPTWKDKARFRFRMLKLYVKRMLGLLKWTFALNGYNILERGEVMNLCSKEGLEIYNKERLEKLQLEYEKLREVEETCKTEYKIENKGYHFCPNEFYCLKSELDTRKVQG